VLAHSTADLEVLGSNSIVIKMCWLQKRPLPSRLTFKYVALSWLACSLTGSCPKPPIGWQDCRWTVISYRYHTSCPYDSKVTVYFYLFNLLCFSLHNVLFFILIIEGLPFPFLFIYLSVDMWFFAVFINKVMKWRRFNKLVIYIRFLKKKIQFF